MSSGTARNTNPAPERTADRAANTGAPVKPTLPHKRNSLPKSPLWAVLGRRGRVSGPFTAHRSPSVSRGAVRSLGRPMSMTRTWPEYTRPWSRYSPGLAAVKVTVMSARTASPRTRPVSPSSPVGRSQATTGQDRLFSRRTAARKARCTGRLRPTPSRASMAQSQRPSQADCSRSSGSKASISPPTAWRRRAISRASAVILAQSPTKMVRTETPR